MSYSEVQLCFQIYHGEVLQIVRRVPFPCLLEGSYDNGSNVNGKKHTVYVLHATEFKVLFMADLLLSISYSFVLFAGAARVYVCM
jgi:hypothetical protein